jgi:hypothetical protein
MSNRHEAAGVEMSRTAAPAPGITPEGAMVNPAQTAAHTGYRVSIVPGALEVSARLANPEELRSLVKVLRASIAILSDEPETDPEPLTLTKRLSEATARSA